MWHTNNCNVFHTACCIRSTLVVQHRWPQSRYTTLGLAAQLNYGLSMPPGLCQSCSSSQRAGVAWADCWRTGCKPPCTLLAVQPAGDFAWTSSLYGISQQGQLAFKRHLTCKLPNNQICSGLQGPTNRPCCWLHGARFHFLCLVIWSAASSCGRCYSMNTT